MRKAAFLLAALLLAYHYNLGALYLNNGTLYDIFCFFFTFAALLWYAHKPGSS